MANLGAIGGFLQGFTQTFQQMQEHELRKRRAAVEAEAEVALVSPASALFDAEVAVELTLFADVRR